MFSGVIPDAFREMPDHESYLWPGQSGRWYAHTVFPLGALPAFLHSANYILVRREAGLCSALYIGETAYERLTDQDCWLAALALGMNELHAHLLAADAAERIEIERDLRGRHWTPLNNSKCFWTPAARPSTSSG